MQSISQTTQKISFNDLGKCWLNIVRIIRNTLVKYVGRRESSWALMQAVHTRSVRKVSDLFLCEHLMDYNLARLHEPNLNLSAHA